MCFNPKKTKQKKFKKRMEANDILFIKIFKKNIFFLMTINIIKTYPMT